MKTSVKPVVRCYFLEEVLANLDKDILTVSKEDANRLVRQIHIKARGDVLEIVMLEELLRYIKKKREYYQNKQHKSYNLVAFKWAVLFLGALLLLEGLLYCFHEYYYKPKQAEMLALIEDLKPYGVIIKDCSERVGRSREYWLEMDGTAFRAQMDILNDQFSNGQLSVEQCDKIKSMIKTMNSMIDQVYKIHLTLHDKFKFKWIITAINLMAFYALERIYFYMKQWYKPRYKERYEKFSWLETKVQKRILYVQKECTVYDETDDEKS